MGVSLRTEILQIDTNLSNNFDLNDWKDFKKLKRFDLFELFE